jgi:tetratricopeptide (TPR) repeat protein
VCVCVCVIIVCVCVCVCVWHTHAFLSHAVSPMKCEAVGVSAALVVDETLTCIQALADLFSSFLIYDRAAALMLACATWCTRCHVESPHSLALRASQLYLLAGLPQESAKALAQSKATSTSSDRGSSIKDPHKSAQPQLDDDGISRAFIQAKLSLTTGNPLPPALMAVATDLDNDEGEVGSNTPATSRRDPAITASALSALADLHFERNNVSEALVASRRALELRRQSKDVRQATSGVKGGNDGSASRLALALVSNLLQLGQLSQLVGLPDEALLYLTKAATYAEHCGALDWCWRSLQSRLALEARLHKFDAAELSAKAAAALVARMEGPAATILQFALDVRLAELELLRQRVELAQAHLARAHTSLPDVNSSLEVCKTNSIDFLYLLTLAGHPDRAIVKKADVDTTALHASIAAELQYSVGRAIADASCGTVLACNAETATQHSLAEDASVVVSQEQSHNASSAQHQQDQQQQQQQQQQHQQQPTLGIAEIASMKVTELKSALERRGLSNKGLKQALVDRLVKAVTEEVDACARQQTQERVRRTAGSEQSAQPATGALSVSSSAALTTTQTSKNTIAASSVSMDAGQSAALGHWRAAFAQARLASCPLLHRRIALALTHAHLTLPGAHPATAVQYLHAAIGVGPTRTASCYTGQLNDIDGAMVRLNLDDSDDEREEAASAAEPHPTSILEPAAFRAKVIDKLPKDLCVVSFAHDDDNKRLIFSALRSGSDPCVMQRSTEILGCVTCVCVCVCVCVYAYIHILMCVHACI